MHSGVTTRPASIFTWHEHVRRVTPTGYSASLLREIGKLRLGELCIPIGFSVLCSIGLSQNVI